MGGQFIRIPAGGRVIMIEQPFGNHFAQDQLPDILIGALFINQTQGVISAIGQAGLHGCQAQAEQVVTGLQRDSFFDAGFSLWDIIILKG